MPKYTPVDLVQLPRLPATGARALGQQVLSAADHVKPFPKGLLKARGRLAAAYDGLQSAVLAQFGAGTAEARDDEPAVQELDRILDNCWAGLDDRLLGLSRLPVGTAGVPEAAALRKRLFPGGLSFLKLPYKLQWSESQVRLDLIEKEGLGASVDQLGGKPFLPAIRQAHAAYGDALGMTQPLPEAAAVPLVRGALDTFAEALRAYIVKVMATVDDDDPASQVVADALLAPLAAWTSSAKRPQDQPGAAVPPAAEPSAPSAGDP